MSYAVKSYMESEVHTISSQVTIKDAAKIMAEKLGSYLIVLQEGSPVGIVTDQDLVNKVLAKDVDPSVIKTVFVNVDVETRGELTLGRTVCDTHHRSKREPNVHVALDADEPKFVKMLMDILGRTA